jgi:nicotinamide riboside kinase
VGERSPKVEEIARARRYDLHILTGDEIAFEQDGYRDGEHIRHWMHEMFVQELKALGRPWALVAGTHDDRMGQATRLIEPLLTGRRMQEGVKVAATSAIPVDRYL